MRNFKVPIGYIELPDFGSSFQPLSLIQMHAPPREAF
jgi:hypothetical protein